MRSEHKFLGLVGQLALWKYGRGYALYERGELIAVFVYRKGALRVAELLAQAWPMRFGKELASKRDQCQIDGKYKVTIGSCQMALSSPIVRKIPQFSNSDLTIWLPVVLDRASKKGSLATSDNEML